MTYTSIIDKLVIFFNLLKNSYFLLIFIGIFIVSIFLKKTNKIDSKKFFLIITLSLFGTFLAVILKNYKILSNTFDNFLDIIFTNIYFPSIYVYLFIIISTYVITIITLFNKRISKISKTANYSMALILNILLILILNIIAKDKIDIFATSSMYTNLNLVAMLELSINIYILWLIVISAIYIINNVTNIVTIRRENRKLVKDPVILEDTIIPSKLESDYAKETTNPIQEPPKPIILNQETSKDTDSLTSFSTLVSKTVEQELQQEESITQPKFINHSIIDQIKENTTTPQESIYDFVRPTNIEEKQVATPSISPILSQILQNTLPMQDEKPIISNDKFTLNDYKTFSKMLKETIKMNNRTTLKVDDMLDSNLLIKFGYEDYSLYQRMLKSFIN